MLIALEIHLDTGATRDFRHAASVLRIGRDPQSDLAFSDRDAKMVSWNHAEITLQDGLVQLADLGSSNGTFLNGQRVASRQTLALHDEIRLGQEGPKLKVIALESDASSAPSPDAPAASEPMVIVVQVSEPSGAIHEIRHQGDTFRIGRDPDAHLSFAGDPAQTVSWNHARIAIDGGRSFVVDEGSSNGTYLNGVRVTGKTVLQAGDQISLGQLGPKITVVELRAQSPTPAGTSQPRQGPLGYLDDNEQPVVQPQQDPLPERPIQEPTPSPAAQEEEPVRPAPIQRVRKPWKTMAAVVALLLLIGVVGIAISEVLPLLNKTTATEQPTLPEAPAPFRGREIRIRFLSATIQLPHTWLERYHQGPETPDPYVVAFHKGKLVFVTQPEGVQVDTYQPRWNVVMPEFFSTTSRSETSSRF